MGLSWSPREYGTGIGLFQILPLSPEYEKKKDEAERYTRTIVPSSPAASVGIGPRELINAGSPSDCRGLHVDPLSLLFLE